MAFNLRNRHFLKLLDFTTEEISYLLRLAADLKAARYAGTEMQRLKGKNIALIFEKASTRTRCAFEVAALDQGAHVTYLGPEGSHIGTKESIRTLRACLVVCMMASSIQAFPRKTWRYWPGMLESLFGMA